MRAFNHDGARRFVGGGAGVSCDEWTVCLSECVLECVCVFKQHQRLVSELHNAAACWQRQCSSPSRPDRKPINCVVHFPLWVSICVCARECVCEWCGIYIYIYLWCFGMCIFTIFDYERVVTIYVNALEIDILCLDIDFPRFSCTHCISSSRCLVDPRVTFLRIVLQYSTLTTQYALHLGSTTP